MTRITLLAAIAAALLSSNDVRGGSGEVPEGFGSIP